VSHKRRERQRTFAHGSKPQNVTARNNITCRSRIFKKKIRQTARGYRGQALYFALLSFFRILQRRLGCLNSCDSILLTLNMSPMFKCSLIHRLLTPHWLLIQPPNAIFQRSPLQSALISASVFPKHDRPTDRRTSPPSLPKRPSPRQSSLPSDTPI
jgi:hypothetical protein